jgi:Phage tail tube protein
VAIGSGLGSQFGIAAQSAYQTYQAPTRFYEVGKSAVKKSKNPTDWTGLAAGRLGKRADGRVVTTSAGAVTIEDLAVTNRDMGLLLNQIFGGTVVPVVQGATTAYLQTHPLVDSAGKTFTAQQGNPLTGGTVVPQSGIGSKVTTAEFSCGVGDLLTVNIDGDCRSVVETQALVAASYVTGRKPFHFAQMGVKLGATAAGAAAVSGVRKVTCKIDRKLKTDMYYANNAGLKDEPVSNDYVEVSGTVTVDYKTAADFADRYRDDTQVALVWEFIGPIIASTFAETFRLTLPAIFFDTDPPTADGPDVITTDFDYTAYVDLAQPITSLVQCEYMSADSAL